MTSLLKWCTAEFSYRPTPVYSNIAPALKFRFAGVRTLKQRGVVLFFTLIALLAMSLAVVALIRSVDTSAMIAGNLAFRQAATTSGDAGVEAAMTWLTTTSVASNGINIMNNTPSIHPFNVDAPLSGYYSSLNTNLSLTDPSQPLHINWTNADSVPLTTDSSGNTVRYVIQRMCRDANQPTQSTPCLYGNALDNPNPQNVLYPQDMCVGPGCPTVGQAPMLRITSRTDGPRNSVSYVQAFVY
jgi:type IV pilus assembly protein PilX